MKRTSLTLLALAAISTMATAADLKGKNGDYSTQFVGTQSTSDVRLDNTSIVQLNTVGNSHALFLSSGSLTTAQSECAQTNAVVIDGDDGAGANAMLAVALTAITAGYSVSINVQNCATFNTDFSLPKVKVLRLVPISG